MAEKKSLKVLSEGAVRKKYPHANTASILLPEENHIWLPSRILPLNWQLGGGIPYGRIVEVFGWESSGKSLLALDFGAVAQQLGGQLLWADAEGAWTNHWAEKNGLDNDKVEVYWGNDIEGIADWIKDMGLFYRNKLENNEPILAVIDSIAAGETAENLDQDIKNSKAEMGNRAKAWDKLLRRRSYFLQKYGITLIIINQLRDKVGASKWEDPTTTPGGKAAKFYSSQRISVFKGKQIQNSYEEKVGQNVNFRIIKNKVAPPKNTVKTEVYFLPDGDNDIGFSKYKGFIEILVSEEVITKKKGPHYYFKGKHLAHGDDAMMEAIHNKSKLRRVLIKKSGINTISKARAHMKSIGKNLFKVGV